MIKILRKLAVRTKLLSSFMILALVILILGITAIIIQGNFRKNQKETLASINLSDAFFEGKYFLRADMHIYTELQKAADRERLNYWWGEHEFQIMFFNDQLQKIEKEFLVNKSFKSDTLQTELLSITAAIRSDYDKIFLSVFDRFRNLKEDELRLMNALSDSSLESTQKVKIEQEITILHEKFAALNREITDYGLNIIKKLDRGKDIVRVVIIDIKRKGQQLMSNAFQIFVTFTLLGIIFSIYVAFYISKLITQPVTKILHHINLLGKGEHPNNFEILLEDEFGSLQQSLNSLTESLVKTSDFSKEIGDGNFESKFTPMGANDVLGNSLLQMRDSLNHSRLEENKRRIEDERRSWAATGVAKFGDIMRQSGESLKVLGYNLISNLIDYVDAVQGALFVINEDNEDDIYYELIAAIAYSREKMMTKKIRIGEGLVGRTVYEEKTIYLKEVPADYVNITSGLGEANPTTILLVPIKLEDKVNGVIEIISFNTFEPYQIEFIEKVGENIASFVSSIKINHKTSILLNESQHKSEELAAQEEEMRQNMEELQATQEEAARREEERELLWDSMGKFLGIIETDLSGNITNSNEKVSSLLGIGASELLHANYKTLFFTDAKTNFDQLWNQITSGLTVNENSIWKGKSTDMRISHELTLVTDLSGKGNKILGLIREIK